jgi:hypothetical protein
MFFLLIVVLCVFAKAWNSYTSIGIEPFTKDSVLYLSFGKDSIEIMNNLDHYEGLYMDLCKYGFCDVLSN